MAGAFAPGRGRVLDGTAKADRDARAGPGPARPSERSSAPRPAPGPPRPAPHARAPRPAPCTRALRPAPGAPRPAPCALHPAPRAPQLPTDGGPPMGRAQARRPAGPQLAARRPTGPRPAARSPQAAGPGRRPQAQAACPQAAGRRPAGPQAPGPQARVSITVTSAELGLKPRLSPVTEPKPGSTPRPAGANGFWQRGGPPAPVLAGNQRRATAGPGAPARNQLRPVPDRPGRPRPTPHAPRPAPTSHAHAPPPAPRAHTPRLRPARRAQGRGRRAEGAQGPQPHTARPATRSPRGPRVKSQSAHRPWAQTQIEPAHRAQSRSQRRRCTSDADLTHPGRPMGSRRDRSGRRRRPGRVRRAHARIGRSAHCRPGRPPAGSRATGARADRPSAHGRPGRPPARSCATGARADWPVGTRPPGQTAGRSCATAPVGRRLRYGRRWAGACAKGAGAGRPAPRGSARSPRSPTRSSAAG